MRLKRLYTLLLGIPILLVSLTSCGGNGFGVPALESSEPKIISHNGYLVSGFPGPYRIVVGEVQNTGDTNLTFVKLEATFSDDNGKIIATSNAYSLMDILLPGEKSPFYFTELTGEDVKQYAVKIAEFDETDNQPYRDFEILDHASTVDELDEYHVSGQVKNTGSEDAEHTNVFATFYGSEGEVVAVGFTTVGVDPWLLSPGQTESFDIAAYPDEATPEIVSYTLHVQ